MPRVLIIVGLIICIGGGALWYSKDSIHSIFFGEAVHWVRIGGAQLFVSVADTPPTRQQGLSGTAGLGEFEGKLFIFDEAAPYGIWMREMNYAIDIVWINDALTVVHVENKVSPDTYPKTFTPPQPARYVLETNSGVAEKYGIRTGDTVSFSEQLTERHQKLLSK